MTLHELVGSLIVGKVAGCRLTSDEENLLRDGTMSGVTLFKENAESLSQLVELIDSIYNLRQNTIIAVDQEGGAVQRFDHILSPLPSQMALAASEDGNTVENIAAINCRQLRLLGVNCLLAPVLDICCNLSNPIIGSRSFSAEPEVVASLGLRFTEAVIAGGLLPAGKHFPGHGDVNVDSHCDIPTLTVTRKQLFQRELIPFQKCMSVLPAILVSHISVPAIDPKSVPASLSYPVVTELLREQLGFEGVIMTDDMCMGAITKHYDLGEAAVKAIAAGVDQILVGGSSEEITTVHRSLMDAVAKGGLTEAQLARSADRIARFAKQFNRIKAPAALRSTEQLNQAGRIEMLERCLVDDTKVSLEIMQSAICLLRGALPHITQGSWNILVPSHLRYSFNLCRYLGTKFANSSSRITELRFPLDPSTEGISTVINRVKGGNADCIFLGFRSKVYAGQIKLAQELNKVLSAQGHKLYCVEVDVPSGLADAPELKNVISTFDPSDAAMEALSKLLLSNRG